MGVERGRGAAVAGRRARAAAAAARRALVRGAAAGRDDRGLAARRCRSGRDGHGRARPSPRRPTSPARPLQIALRLREAAGDAGQARRPGHAEPLPRPPGRGRAAALGHPGRRQRRRAARPVAAGHLPAADRPSGRGRRGAGAAARGPEAPAGQRRHRASASSGATCARWSAALLRGPRLAGGLDGLVAALRGCDPDAPLAGARAAGRAAGLARAAGRMRRGRSRRCWPRARRRCAALLDAHLAFAEWLAADERGRCRASCGRGRPAPARTSSSPSSRWRRTRRARCRPAPTRPCSPC